MKTILIILFNIAILLFILSFFLPDPNKQLKEEVEQLSLQFYQESYQLKRRLKVLEEELLMTDGLRQNQLMNEPHEIIVNQVKQLAKQGLPIEQIAKQSALSSEDVKAILGTTKGMTAYE